VGYDMYCRLLRRAVQGARGQVQDEEPGEIEVELGVTAFLPAEYVPDPGVRMSLLRRMAAAGNRRLDTLERELADRFGRIPPPARELLSLFRLRHMVRLAGISSLLLDGFGGIVITVTDERAWDARGPFPREQLSTLSPGRWRYALPEAVRTPEQRLAHLLQRFAGRARARPARRHPTGRAG
jgi:transcription-repair coupling factor (superfamily II helicase)